MMYAYDRLAVINGIFAGQVEYPDSFLPRALTFWHTNDLQHYPYDPVKARAMLDADGWRPDADGIRRKGNVRLSFELMLNQGSALITDEMLTFAADMRSVGIDVHVRLIDFASMSSRTYTGRYDMIADARGGVIDPDYTSLFASTQIPPNGANTTYYSNPRVDRDLKLGLQTLDPAKRRVYYDDFQRQLALTLPVLYQYGRFASLGHDSRLHLVPGKTLQSPLFFYNVQDWTLGS
jgi:peptide/nickel transport system substrate-binding protein